MSANLNLIIAPAPAETALPQTTSPRSATLAEGPSHPRQSQERKASNDDRQAFRRLIDADAKRTSPQADAASAAARAPDQQTTQRTRERIDRDDRSPSRTSPEDRDHSTDVLLFSVVVAPLLETAPVGLLENLHACPNVASDGSEESISQELNFQGDSARAATEFGLRQVIQQLADVPQQEFDGESLDRASLLSDTVAHTATDEKAARFVTIPTVPRFDELPAPDLTRHNQSAVTDASLSPEPNGPNAELIEPLPALPEPVERLISDPSSPGNDAVAAPKEVAAATIAAPFAEIAKKPVVPNQAANRSGVNTTSPVEARDADEPPRVPGELRAAPPDTVVRGDRPASVPASQTNGLNGEYGPVEFGVDRPDAGAASAADIEETGHSAADSSADAEFVQPLLIGLPQTSRAASVYGLSQSAERITSQVAESILTQALTTEQGDTITLDAILDPPDLGRVHIRLTRSESSLTAHVRAENSDVQHIIAEYGGLIEQGVRTQLRSDGVLHFALADSHLGQGSSAPGGHEPPPRPTLWTSGHRDHTRVTTARQSAGRSNAEVDVLA